MTSDLKASTERWTSVRSADDQADLDQRALLEQVFRRHAQLVRSYVARRLPLEDVDDVVSETFAAVWRKIADCPGEATQHLWLLGIARGLVANAQRSSARRRALRALLLRQPMEAECTPDTAAQHVRAALQKLPQAQQEVLRLALWEELAHRDIAEVLGCSPNAVAVRLSRARSQLRRALNDNMTNDKPDLLGPEDPRSSNDFLAAGSESS